MESKVSEFSKGWRVLLAATLGCGLGAAAFITATLGFFMPAFEAEKGWDRVQVGGAATAFLLGVLCFSPVAGRLCDRLGSRKTAFGFIILLVAALMGIGVLVDDLWALYLGYFLVGLAGAGTSFVVYSRAVNTWFDSARGLALGIMIGGSGLTMAVAPFIITQVVTGYGWRAGYFALAALSATALVAVIPWLKERPVERGSSEQLSGMSLSEILKTRHFWTIAVALVLISPVFSGAVVHLAPMYRDLGASSPTIQIAAASFGFSMILVRPVIGQFLDRWHPPAVAAAALSLPALALLFAGEFGPSFAVPYAIALGVGLSAESDLVAYLASRYFGMRAFSEAYGWLFAASTVGFALGPILAGKAYELSGDYDFARMAAAACCLAGAACFVSLGRSPRQVIDTPAPATT